MKKLTLRKRRWLLSKSKKTMKILRIKNKHKKNPSTQYINRDIHKFNNKHIKVLKVPTIFSIVNNVENTLNFFDNVYNEMKRIKYQGQLFFDLSKVDLVTVDAIMYLIALIKNTKRLMALKITCSGNVPIKESARKILENSGFYKYVVPQYSVKYVNRGNINISSGYEADPELAGEICNFVHKNSCLNRLNTKSLFPMIMELMTNTKQHAYGDNDGMKNKWYIFVENCDDKIQFVFLDTGAGIPKTIKIYFWEKIKKLVKNNDAYFIASALRGDFRTETNLDYRGKGLPEIYNRISDRLICDFSVVSGYGKCDVNNNGGILETQLNSMLRGTLFCWTLKK